MNDAVTASGWQEVGDGVFGRRYDPLDISIGAIIGTEGLTVVDTRGTPAEAQRLLRDIGSHFGLPVVAAINTHAHYDHTFGNQVFDLHGIPIYGHWLIPRHHAQHEAQRLDAVQHDPLREPDKDWSGVSLTPPSVLVDSPSRLQLGRRAVTLLPIDPGHTDTDLAVHVPDAGVWFLGDVIEQSGPPMFGSGSYPLSWASAPRAASQHRT